MSRSRPHNTRTRRRGNAELLAAFDQGLSTLSELAKVYDRGHSPIVFLIATEIHKILTENVAATRLRRTRNFTSPEYPDDRQMLNAMHKLTTARLRGEPAKLEFLPTFYSAEHEGPLRNLNFRDWWNRDVIYRASAALPGTPAGLIPVNDTPTVPHAKREKVTRRELIAILRNKLGAHQDVDFPTILDDLESSNNWAAFAIQTPEGVLSTEDGTLPVDISPLPAMVRQICHELLIAYDRPDPPPLPLA